MPGQPKVLILRSNPIAPDPRVEKIARVLSGAGYSVNIVCWDRSAQLKVVDEVQGTPVVRLPIKASYGNGLGNLPALLRWQAGIFTWLIRNHANFDIIHACDFDTVLPALAGKMLWGKILVYDIFDFYADHLRRTPGWIKKIIRFLDYRAINRADGVILVDDARFEQIQGTHPKICIAIYNSPEDTTGPLNPLPEAAQAASFSITYVGLLQVERGIFELLNVLRRRPEWHLHLAGFGGDEDRIMAAAQAMENVSWYGRVAYDKALQLSMQADVLFATYDPDIPNHRYSSANKLFEAMMLGKPVIVARDTNMDRVVERESCGIVVDYGDEAGLEQALSKLAEDPELRYRLGANSRRAYVERYSWAKMASRLVGLYQMILVKGGK